ncbi:MAG: hypothetical protein ACTSV0_11220 [Candidatus Freyarchaeota archaeon]
MKLKGVESAQPTKYSYPKASAKRASFRELTGALKPIKEVKTASVVGAEKYEIGHCRMQLKHE